MKTSAPTDPLRDIHTGATCHLFADTMGGTLTEPAANSHASGKATASMATTADDALVVPVVELPAYDPPATQSYGQHATPLTRSPVTAAQGGSEPYTRRPKIWHSPSLLRIPTCCRTSLGTAPRNLKPISTPHTRFEDAVVLTSTAQVHGLFLQHATEMCQRRCHPCNTARSCHHPSLF
ncbi:hypothetical protein MTO96_012036 [Rhipicephalus appendiculatus]